jgi:hypothetical protein
MEIGGLLLSPHSRAIVAAMKTCIFEGTAPDAPKLDASPPSADSIFENKVGKSTPSDSKSLETACWMLSAVTVVLQDGLPLNSAQLGAGKGALASTFLYA